MPSTRANISLGYTCIGIAIAFGLINTLVVASLNTCCQDTMGYLVLIGFMSASSNFILGFSMEKIIRIIKLYDYHIEDHIV